MHSDQLEVLLNAYLLRCSRELVVKNSQELRGHTRWGYRTEGLVEMVAAEYKQIDVDSVQRHKPKRDKQNKQNKLTGLSKIEIFCQMHPTARSAEIDDVFYL